MSRIKQYPLTNEIKQQIYAGFGEDSILATGINGLSRDPIVFELSVADKSLGWIVIQHFWGQLHIKYLYVEHASREKRYATELMRHALNFGRKEGCAFAFVETMSFQAPEFYQKIGFKIDFVRSRYAKDSSFYYMSFDLKQKLDQIEIKLLEGSMIQGLVESFAAAHWSKPKELFEGYLKEQHENTRFVWVAFYKNQIAGYNTLTTQSKYNLFRESKIPEIMDLNVLPSFRRLGIGSNLMDAAEAKAAFLNPVVGIGVGLYEGYGDAQKLYVRRGYIPMGTPITYDYKPLDYGSQTTLDDDLVLWFTKKLNCL